MQVDRPFELKSFAQLGYGTLFVGILGQRHVIRGIKAYSPSGIEDREDFFVTVGPFATESGSFPVLYHPNALHDKPVLVLEGRYQILPSLAPDDIMVDLPAAKYARGVLLLGEDCVLLGVANVGTEGAWNLCYLNPGTGEIMAPPLHPRFIATRGWRLIGPGDGGEPTTIFEFRVETEKS